MIRKKQVIVALSIVTVAFLLGTVTMTAMGGGWREYMELWEAINQIQEELAEKQAKLESVQEEIADLQSQIEQIQLIPGPKGDKGDKGDPGPPGGFGAPDYDSGWRSIPAGTLDEWKIPEGDLDINNILVYVIGRDEYGHVHHLNYGTDAYNFGPNWRQYGLWWQLDTIAQDGNIRIVVIRCDDDAATVAPWDEYRLLIWSIQSP